MRKIEKEMNKAITEGRNWSSSNTMVRVDPDTNKSMVYLHNNHIATVDRVASEWGWYHTVKTFEFRVVVNEKTLSNWSTNTTKSRLRALGVDVYTKAGTVYLNGSEVA
jgi:hypothetical protein